MVDLEYVVYLGLRDKGLAYTAKDALQNAQRAETSPIKSARFVNQPTSSHAEILVTLNDTSLVNAITTAITASGRMPSKEGVYTIDAITLRSKEDVLRGEIENIHRKNDRQLGALREENARLRLEVDNRRPQVGTPLDGLLAYFETLTYSPEVILEDSSDLDFARRVFSAEIVNTFVYYANHVLGESFTENEVTKILNYESKPSDEMAQSRVRYDLAKEELQFLEKLNSGDVTIPVSLRGDCIRVIQDKNHEITVQEYESALRDQENLQLKQSRLRQLKERYASFSEHLNLLTDAGSKLPLIFDRREDYLDIYFPFHVRSVRKGFVEDLFKEVGAYFEGTSFTPLEGEFVACRINSRAASLEEVDHLVADVPITLRVAGFNQITPYKLG